MTLPTFAVNQQQIIKCKSCQAEIVWQLSYRNGKRYPVDVRKNSTNGQLESSRNWFHKCPAQATLFPQAQPQTVAVQPPAQYLPTKQTQVAKRDAMKLFIEKANEPQLRAALKAIFNRQTNQEQNSDATLEDNNVGFTGTDGFILSDICKRAQQYGYLKGKQVDLVRRKLKKYSRQLVSALEQGEWAI